MNHENIPFAAVLVCKPPYSYLFFLNFACKLTDKVFTSNWEIFHSLESTEKGECVRFCRAGEHRNCFKE